MYWVVCTDIQIRRLFHIEPLEDKVDNEVFTALGITFLIRHFSPEDLSESAFDKSNRFPHRFFRYLSKKAFVVYSRNVRSYALSIIGISKSFPNFPFIASNTFLNIFIIITSVLHSYPGSRRYIFDVSGSISKPFIRGNDHFLRIII